MNNAIEIQTPVDEKEARGLKVGDIVYITGEVVAMRDKAHALAVELSRKGEHLPFRLEGLAVYHCGPLVRRLGRKWLVVSAGPTTSMRMEPFEKEILEKFRPRLIVGKGGMGGETLKALSKVGAAYLAYPGGAGVLAAKAVIKVADVFWYDLGPVEAVWVLKVERMGPCVVAMDSHGNSLYRTAASLHMDSK